MEGIATRGLFEKEGDEHRVQQLINQIDEGEL